MKPKWGGRHLVPSPLNTPPVVGAAASDRANFRGPTIVGSVRMLFKKCIVEQKIPRFSIAQRNKVIENKKKKEEEIYLPRIITI